MQDERSSSVVLLVDVANLKGCDEDCSYSVVVSLLRTCHKAVTFPLEQSENKTPKRCWEKGGTDAEHYAVMLDQRKNDA